jgi:hypothetical protein
MVVTPDTVNVVVLLYGIYSRVALAVFVATGAVPVTNVPPEVLPLYPDTICDASVIVTPADISICP